MIQYSKDKFGGHLAMLATALIFGMNGPLSAVLVGPEGELTPGTHMFARFSVATVLFWCVSFFLPRTKVERKDFGRIFMASVFGVLLNQSGFAIAMSLTTPIHQSLMASLGPVFTIVLAFFILREPISLLKAGGVAFGALGVLTLLFVRTGGEGLGEGTLWGDLVALIATLSYCIYLTVYRDLIDKYEPWVLMRWMFLFTLILVAPFTIGDVIRTPWSTLSEKTIGALSFVVFFATFVAYFLLPVGQKRLRPTVVSIYNYFNPVIATTLALLWGLEEWTWAKGLAAALVVLGVYMVTKSKSRADQLRERGVQQPEHRDEIETVCPSKTTTQSTNE
ncbi:MAG: DMT family transporter [Porphyromonas sp.]|nr:DMT family transporter [Porphyromonas sp.]